ncbi:MAG: MFS transporter, partial [Bacteroidota bacterium]
MFGHPKGLYILFFTEMWERFSYYGMRGLLVIYMTASAMQGEDPRGLGLGWSDKEALELYGWYTMLVYVMGIPGGMIADKLIGQKKAVLLGALILCFGHGVLVLTDTWAYYTVLGLVILGVGLLKT